MLLLFLAEACFNLPTGASDYRRSPSAWLGCGLHIAQFLAADPFKAALASLSPHRTHAHRKASSLSGRQDTSFGLPLGSPANTLASSPASGEAERNTEYGCSKNPWVREPWRFPQLPFFHGCLSGPASSGSNAPLPPLCSFVGPLAVLLRFVF